MLIRRGAQQRVVAWLSGQSRAVRKCHLPASLLELGALRAQLRGVLGDDPSGAVVVSLRRRCPSVDLEGERHGAALEMVGDVGEDVLELADGPDPVEAEAGVEAGLGRLTTLGATTRSATFRLPFNFAQAASCAFAVAFTLGFVGDGVGVDKPAGADGVDVLSAVEADPGVVVVASA